MVQVFHKEPSLGKFRPIENTYPTGTTGWLLNLTMPVANTWSGPYSVVGLVPSNAIAIHCRCFADALSTAAGDVDEACYFDSKSTHTPPLTTGTSYYTSLVGIQIYWYATGSNQYHRACLPVRIPLNSSLQYYVYQATRTNGSGGLYLALCGYELQI